ncbi:MAG: HAMP domain-containing sensor histidine kinase [Limosilactobacillus sp.]|uniref:sensor histidine kinase n=1 Tax=Limosilactobacillus sp. TaxID=2773925 RepID=UPI0027014479|nr:HAMP domain-containing sensor histidine kinase [Limosilactobacillus sp.]
MIQHFRKKFVIMSTLALVMVIVTIVGSISGITYYRAHQEVNGVLTTLSRNEGQIPQHQNKNNLGFLPQQHYNKDAMMQYRFFSATILKKGGTKVDNRHIFAVSQKTVRKLAKKVASKGAKRGYVLYNNTVYAYMIKKTSSQTTVVFLDETLMMARAWEIIYVGVALGFVCLVIYTILLLLFSQRAIRPIIQSEERQKEFITNAGHELKTPLAVISANTEMMEITDGGNELTASTKQQVKRMTELINYLVSLARLQEQPQLDIQTIDASQLVSRSAESFKNVISTDGHEFKQSIEPDLRVRADENYFYELINILVDNANKYCDPGGTVEVSLTRNKKNVDLVVTNDYKDGEKVDTSRFFERFYRNDRARTLTKKAGYGIGLSMAQSLVKNFNGRISVKYSGHKISFVVSLRRV